MQASSDGRGSSAASRKRCWWGYCRSAPARAAGAALASIDNRCELCSTFGCFQFYRFSLVFFVRRPPTTVLPGHFPCFRPLSWWNSRSVAPAEPRISATGCRNSCCACLNLHHGKLNSAVILPSLKIGERRGKQLQGCIEERSELSLRLRAVQIGWNIDIRRPK